MKTIALLSLLVLAVSDVQAQNSTLENGHGVVSYYVNTNQTSWYSDGSVLADTIVPDGFTIETDADGGIDIVLGKIVKLAKPYNSFNQKPSAQNVIRLGVNTSVTINHTTVIDTGVDEVASGQITLNSGNIQVSLNRRAKPSSLSINYLGGSVTASDAVFSLNSEGSLVVYSGNVSVAQGGKVTNVSAADGIGSSNPTLSIPYSYWQTSSTYKDSTQTYISPTHGVQ